ARRPRSPVPRRVSAPPQPASLTSTTSRPEHSRPDTDTSPAPACRTALTTASLTTKKAVISTGAGYRPAGRSTRTGTGARSAYSSTASASPRSVTSDGWMPRATSRSSTNVSRASEASSSSTGTTSGGERGDGHQPAGRIDVLRTRPEPDRERRVAQRPRQQVAYLGRIGGAFQLDHQVGHPQPGQPDADQPAQERERQRDQAQPVPE